MPTVLLIEDDEFYVDVIRTIVQIFGGLESGTKFTRMANVPDDPDQLQQVLHDNPPGLVILDLDRDGERALEFSSKLRDNPATKLTRVVALSRKESTEEEARSRGCTSFLVKPFKVKDFTDAISSGVN